MAADNERISQLRVIESVVEKSLEPRRSAGWVPTGAVAVLLGGDVLTLEGGRALVVEEGADTAWWIFF